MSHSATLPRTAYFHGVPGGADEWRFFAPPNLPVFAPDRNSRISPVALAEQVSGNCCQESLTLIGFSLGAPIALAVARELGGRVAHIHLISPAAPLQLGNFLDEMAGGALFRMSRSSRTLLRVFARLESMVARSAPHFLVGRLFASAVGEDAALRCDPAFRSAMARVLREGLGRDPSGLVAEINAYVADWRQELAQVHSPVTIWQGELDNWTPPAMAQALAAALPGPVTLHLLPQCSHYSALRALNHPEISGDDLVQEGPPGQKAQSLLPSRSRK